MLAFHDFMLAWLLAANQTVGSGGSPKSAKDVFNYCRNMNLQGEGLGLTRVTEATVGVQLRSRFCRCYGQNDPGRIRRPSVELLHLATQPSADDLRGFERVDSE